MDDVEEGKKKASICLRGLCGSWKMLDGLPSMHVLAENIVTSVGGVEPGGQGDCFLLLVTPHATSKGVHNSQSQVKKKKKMVVKKRVATAVEKDTRIIRSAITGKRG